MKTIQFLSESLKLAQQIGTPANISVGTFEIKSTGSLSFWAGRTGTFDNYTLKFRLEFRPDHIQMLLNMGVFIDFSSVVMAGLTENAKRFKSGREAIKQGRYAPYYYMGDPTNNQTGVIENWLHADALCTIECLEKLDAICRDNHLHQIAIHNDHTLINAGVKKVLGVYVTPAHVASHRERIEAIRKMVRKMNKKATTPYHISCTKKYNF